MLVYLLSDKGKKEFMIDAEYEKRAEFFNFSLGFKNQNYMKALKAIYDGEKILLEGEAKLPKNSKLIVILLEDDTNDWHTLSSQSLNRAYGEQEPEYTLSEVKEPNLGYESR